jgi:hypothetical protein
MSQLYVDSGDTDQIAVLGDLHNNSIQYFIYLRAYSASQRSITKLSQAKKERNKQTNTNRKQN